MARPILSKTLRGDLEKVILKAREHAESAARDELIRLGINSTKVPEYLDEAEKAARRDLRAHGRQLGDQRQGDGSQDLDILTEEVAYEHWHRMLFPRFLIENGLLIHPDHGVGVSMDELEHEASKVQKSTWQLAGSWACVMLPQIFRQNHPAFMLRLSDIAERELEELLSSLPREVFTARDSLGWVYQFWQSERKAKVDKAIRSGLKVGFVELGPKTQLFTEPYMVSFLLDNALGAWWAGKRLSEEDLRTATTEEYLRVKASLPGVPLEYLRFVKTESGTWEPAAGYFECWPSSMSEVKILDPCCGSGHFLVALFEMLVPLRMEAEGLSAREATKYVLSQNLHALELDKRCVELAAFNLALAAWLFPGAGGYHILPELHIACSGLSISAAKHEWEERFAFKGKNQRIAMDWLYDTFRDAPVLGSLINPSRHQAAGIVPWSDLKQLLGEALKTEDSGEKHEAGVVAQGLAKAAELLTGHYSWVVTNVPYLGRGDHCTVLADFCETNYEEAKSDLATVFQERCLEFCAPGGSTSIVLPQNWLFLTSYRKFREKLLKRDVWHLIGRLGEHGFDSSAAAGAFVALLTISRGVGPDSGELFGAGLSHFIHGVDVSEMKTAAEKAVGIINGKIKTVEQAKQLENPDARVILEEVSSGSLLAEYAEAPQGIKTGDDNYFRIQFWEKLILLGWRKYQSSPSGGSDYSGMSFLIRWSDSGASLARLQGDNAWGKRGIAVCQMRDMPHGIYFGDIQDSNINVIVPKKETDLLPIAAYVTSNEYKNEIRSIDQKLSVTNATMLKVPFNIEHWTRVAKEKYPQGFPYPYSNDPTQWIFHGHPAGSVVWDKRTQTTTNAGFRIDGTVLQVATARLLGYRWPAELDSTMQLAPEQRAWVDKCAEILPLADDDGIVCIPPVRGERAAVERLRTMLRTVYSGSYDEYALLTASDSAGGDLETWLRDRFFEQHCKLFQHRPFVWQIWDGDPRGFSALVNYHKLDFSTLEKLTHTYLGDWITQQQSEAKLNLPGAETRLIRARALQDKLKLILKGERPYDIFIRWKPLEEQPIGWNPDLNDGVRLNIRPFVTAELLRCFKKPKLNIEWGKDRGKDVVSAPWFHQFQGERINDWHTSLEEKQRAQRKENGKN